MTTGAQPKKELLLQPLTKLMTSVSSRISIAMLAGTLLLGACGLPKKTVYFKDYAPQDTTVFTQTIDRDIQTVIQNDDMLAINVTSTSSVSVTDPTAIFNEGGTPYSITAMQGNIAASASVSNHGGSFLVDKDGFIDYPVLGKINVARLNIRQAKELLSQKLKAYIKDPVCEVRIINYKVIVLGEVARPGTVIAPNHKINIIEAIATVGDILPTGEKDHVDLIREEGNKQTRVVLNLNSNTIFTSPYYYLKQNDIISVRQNAIQRQQNNQFVRFYLPLISGLLATALSVYGIVKISNLKNN